VSPWNTHFELVAVLKWDYLLFNVFFWNFDPSDLFCTVVVCFAFCRCTATEMDIFPIVLWPCNYVDLLCWVCWFLLFGFPMRWFLIISLVALLLVHYCQMRFLLLLMYQFVFAVGRVFLKKTIFFFNFFFVSFNILVSNKKNIILIYLK